MSDNNTPVTRIQDPDRGYREWHIDEIYDPGKTTGRIVPNVNDAVRDWNQGILRVVAVDYTTGISQRLRWVEPRDNNDVNDEDVLLGHGPGTQSESFRISIDTSIFPHSLSFDGRMHVYGTTTTGIRVFLGTDISQGGTVISAHYDQNGQLLGDMIPLELVKTASPADNRAIKTPMPGYTVRQLPDGEVVTSVLYNDAGRAVSTAKHLIVNSALTRKTDASTRYITAISLETPFISGTNPYLIECPINMPIENLNLMGVVHYSDGSRRRLPVDGTKFALYGLENYVATIQGQTEELRLLYRLSPDEVSYVGQPSAERHIREAYWLSTQETDGAYSVKLYAYPKWIGELEGYTLEYFLYDLRRSQMYPVTNFVTFGADSRAFSPLLYGVVQRISVGVNLREVDTSFANYRHTQTFDIALLARGDDRTTSNWEVGFSSGQNPPYGRDGAKALANFINTGNWNLDITGGAVTEAEWVEKFFYGTQPLFDSQTEVRAPMPNFIAVRTGSHRVELPLANWNTLINVHEVPANGGTIYIEFMRRDGQNDLQLAIAGMIVHHGVVSQN